MEILPQSTKAQASLTARRTCRADAKAEFSDPMRQCGMRKAQRIKVTLGITGWSCPSVHSDGKVWHLDVGSSLPGGVVAPKGCSVRTLKRHASWVQNVVRQFGPYLVLARNIWGSGSLVREDRDPLASGVSAVLPRALSSSYAKFR